MKSRYIPATLDLAKRSFKYITDQIIELEAATATRKRPSLRDALLKERLQGLLVMECQSEYEMGKFGKLLDAKNFTNAVNQKSKSLVKLKKVDLAKTLAETQVALEIERGYAEIINRAMEYLWHVVDGDEYRKIDANSKRQTEREKNFELDQSRMLEVLIELRQKYLPRALSWGDFPEYKKNMEAKYPKPAYEQEVRIVGEHKKLKGEDLASHKRSLREVKAKNPWGTRLSDFYQERNNLPSPRSRVAS